MRLYLLVVGILNIGIAGFDLALGLWNVVVINGLLGVALLALAVYGRRSPQ